MMTAVHTFSFTQFCYSLLKRMELNILHIMPPPTGKMNISFVLKPLSFAPSTSANACPIHVKV